MQRKEREERRKKDVRIHRTMIPISGTGGKAHETAGIPRNQPFLCRTVRPGYVYMCIVRVLSNICRHRKYHS
jgi:hypothetical protein